MNDIQSVTDLLNEAAAAMEEDAEKIQYLTDTIAAQEKALDILEQIVETQRKTIDVQQQSIDKLTDWAAKMGEYIDHLEAHLEQTLSAYVMHTSN